MTKSVKICSKCGKQKDFIDFHKNNKAKDGLNYWCKSCIKQWNKDNKEHLKRYRKQYRQDNKERIKKYCKQWCQNNKKHKKEYKRKWYLENIDHCKEYHKKNREKQQEQAKYRYKKMDKNERRLRNKLWREKNRKRSNELMVLSNARRRARKKNLVSNLTEKQWEFILEVFSHSCAYCGEFIENLHQDHVIPVANNGGYIMGNIVPACKSCNSSKKDSDYLIWMKEKKYNYQDFDENMLIIFQQKYLELV